MLRLGGGQPQRRTEPEHVEQGIHQGSRFAVEGVAVGAQQPVVDQAVDVGMHGDGGAAQVEVGG
ncbi:hypothetical protein D3C86_2248050 [compost metagenome]